MCRETPADQHSRSYFYFIQLFDQMIGCKGLNKKFLWQRRALELHGDHVHHAGRVDALPPRRLGSSVEWMTKLVISTALSGSTCSSICSRSGRCSLASSSTTCQLVTRNNRPSRSKKKPVALVSSCSSSKVETRVTESKSDSITIRLVTLIRHYF